MAQTQQCCSQPQMGGSGEAVFCQSMITFGVIPPAAQTGEAVRVGEGRFSDTFLAHRPVTRPRSGTR